MKRRTFLATGVAIAIAGCLADEDENGDTPDDDEQDTEAENGESEQEDEDENGTSEENATSEDTDENSTGNGDSEKTDREEEEDETDETEDDEDSESETDADEPVEGNDDADETDGPDEEEDETDEVDPRASLEDLELAELNVANVSPDEEYIVLRNTGDGPLDLSGYHVRDGPDGQIDRGLSPLTFPSEFTLEAGEEVTIWTGEGTNTDSELYWDYGVNIWNEDGDIVVVQDTNEARFEAEYPDQT